jgi:hypothetical protein
VRKIPTLFRRDPDDMKRVLPEVNLECQWVLDGDGVATRKYDGTCVMLDGAGDWWARREVKPGKATPPNFEPISTDDVTGKTVGWEPIEQSAFAKYHAEAVAAGAVLPHLIVEPLAVGGTYELIGPKVNGNPEKISEHLLVRHGYTAAVDYREMEPLPRTFDGLRGWLHAHPAWEGIVWHHPDGRMAKLKRRDFV